MHWVCKLTLYLRECGGQGTYVRRKKYVNTLGTQNVSSFLYHILSKSVNLIRLGCFSGWNNHEHLVIIWDTYIFNGPFFDVKVFGDEWIRRGKAQFRDRRSVFQVSHEILVERFSRVLSSIPLFSVS